MSDHESSNAPRVAEDSGQFTRWPGMLSLALGVLLGPIAALVNEEATYAANMWTCGRGFHLSMNIVPALSLIVIAGAGVGGYLNWRAVGKGVEDEQGTVEARTRFLALLAMTISVLSSLVVLAQWLAIGTFDPCMRA